MNQLELNRIFNARIDHIQMQIHRALVIPRYMLLEERPITNFWNWVWSHRGAMGDNPPVNAFVTAWPILGFKGAVRSWLRAIGASWRPEFLRG